MGILNSRFDEWQTKFTYRQKFLFLALIYAVSIPFGLYVALHTMNYIIQSKGIQQIGSNYQKKLGALYDSLLRYQVMQAPSDEMKLSLNQGVLAALKSLREIEESNHLFPQKYGRGFSAPWVTELNVFGWQKRWHRALNEGSDSPFLESLIIDVRVALERSGEDLLLFNNDNPIIEQLATPIIRHLPDIEMITAHLASSQPLSSDETLKLAAEKIRLEEAREELERVLSDAIHAYVAEYPEQSDVAHLQIALGSYLKERTTEENLWALQQLRLSVIHMIDTILKDGIHHICMAKRGLIGLCLVSTLIIVAFIVLRGLSSHFFELASHVEDLAKGAVSSAHPPLSFCSKEKDEFGDVGRLLDELARTTGKSVLDIQEFYKKTQDVHNHLSFISRDVAEIMHRQETALSHLETTIQRIALKARQLAEGMERDTKQTEGTDVEEGLKRLQISMSSLVEEASRMVNLVTGVEDHVEAMHHLIAFINKISERANLLSLNAAIETATVTRQKESFASITEKIQRFAIHTSGSTQEIRAIFQEMSSNIAKVKAQAITCFQDIHEGSEQLVPVNNQLKRITQRGMEQQKKYEQFGDSMKSQATNAEELAQSLTELNAMSLDNRQLVRTLQESLEDIEVTDRELKRLLKKWNRKS
ncbi:MAG: methyl-accepting chemotaxis protein [Parachlamydia sp.]|nr:methyl-accepting chemotaxis protein [Parachlamydia sp.]